MRTVSPDSRFALFAIVSCTVVAVLPASAVKAAFIPPDLLPGSQYQLVFVTSGGRDATSSSIADYNTFVTTQAALNPLLPPAAWHAVASTAAVKAHINAPSGGLPVYNTQGILVASASTGLYTDHLVNPIAFDQFGVLAFYPPFGSSLGVPVWTGTEIGGIPGVTTNTFPLGSGAVEYGGSALVGQDWLWWNNLGSTQLHQSLYALSDPITVPEPGTVTLLGSALLTLCGIRFRRWRRRIA